LISSGLVVATVASYAVGAAIGVPWLMPVLNTLASYPFMIAALRAGDLRVAVARMLVWALAMAVCATLIAYAWPWKAGALFLRGEAYRAEMFTWLMTGRGPESTPSQFVPQQLRDAAIFVVLALATAGALAMPMGALLMNQMGTYVGSLAATAAHPAAAALLGWHPWAVIRIASFVVLGVVLSAPLLARVMRCAVDWTMARRLAAWAAGGLAADIVLKTLLAPAWQRMLLRVAGW
jgi:hypothetical protein